MIAAGPSLAVAAGRREFWLLWNRGELFSPVRAYSELWKAIAAARVVRKWAGRYGLTVDEFLIRYFEGKFSNSSSPAGIFEHGQTILEERRFQ